MSNWNWKLYGNNYTPENPTDGPILVHEIYSKNGAYGECLICFDHREKNHWFIIAGGNDTGRLWKSPDETYSTIEEAKLVAEKTWRPVVKKGGEYGKKENPSTIESEVESRRTE